MRRLFHHLSLLLIPALLLAAVPLATAQERLDRPRDIAPTKGFIARPSTAAGGPLATQGFSPGKPPKLFLLDAWMESSLLPNDVTASLWQTNEILYLVGWFSVPQSRNVTVSVEVLNTANVSVFQDTLSGPPAVLGVNGFVFELGQYGAGFYQVKYRVKQGKKSVGMRFWIEVALPEGLGTAL